MARAERIRRVEGGSLRDAARKLRSDRAKIAQAARGEITPQVMFVQIRADVLATPPALRKHLHDVRGTAVRT